MNAERITLCGTDNTQPGTKPYHVGYSNLVDGYRHAWAETVRGRTIIRHGRDFGHPHDPRCPECYPSADKEGDS